METERRILQYLAGHEQVSGRELCEYLGITRQALHLHLRRLILEGKVVKSGSTRAARYTLASRAVRVAVSREPALAGLDESAVYEELALQLNLASALPHNVEAILRYGFTKMLNNAIEHSEAATARVRVEFDPALVTFEIRDMGIGVFHSISRKLGLDSEQAAMVELLKGRTTTGPEAHTGEGIFFSARAADRFTLRSHRIEVEWNASKNDVFVARRRFLRGTNVHFTIRRSSRRRLEQVFATFAPEEFDYRFERTRMYVKLLRQSYVSRSEAKRLLANAEKFREIVLDFREVESVGQGFADEVFRVFSSRHPGIRIVAENANPVLDAMFRHVGRG